MDYFQLLLLAATAGFTIFLGLSLSIFQNISASKKRLHNAFVIGILVFLLVNVFGHAWDSTGDSKSDNLMEKHLLELLLSIL
jgi:uncharacterized membrane protein YqjE